MAQSSIAAAGAVVWRDGTVAVAHRPRYDDWSLPKGKLDRGETVPQAAVREVAEETGFDVVLGRHLNTVRYCVGEAAKQVDYFAARAIGGHFEPNDEVDELRWLPPAQAAAILTYPQDVAVLAEFTRLPAETRSVLLVRHAKAGKREDWHGPDSLRPLSAAGKRQADALRDLLPLFGAERMHSAPPERCVQTIAGLAGDLGRTVAEEPLLGELDYSGDPEAGRRRLLELVAAEGTPVICSQGGVIPGLICALAKQSGLDLPEVRAKKGSLWVLSFVHPGPELVAADYYPSPLPKP
ncbi:8-oxo-dGTP diphosphatase [Kibdelosporangium banguiense]|uniref:8-oxo-dGTP diphosphatase n=1 Tax=Kibdelosporangium banguiense TaxID=1365924 RepID=A0ABS4TGY9_9PSEU|nr:NUDIX hydrolase [Kibdelosporangium banguiense]MBP2323659.1 8-oxo-dGTP diphosphatase [Kibdelosporangium banguiense]